MITKEQLKKIVPFSTQKNIDLFLPSLNELMEKHSINKNVYRKASFIAQIAHESGSFQYVKELASGKDYEGRKDLGNTQPGDGVKFKGRGLIQITGHDNYKKLSDYIGVDFIANPEKLEWAKYAVLSAIWFWETKKLNEIADVGDFKKITKIINGGYNGLADREEFYKRGLEVLK
jgi:putative chitinase